MKKISILNLLLALIILISCSKSNENKNAKEILSSYLKDNKEVLAFGKVDIKSILQKADYKSVPKVNVLLIE